MNLARATTFAETNTVLDSDEETAREYGRVKALLRSKGQPLPENDVWIAAAAIRHGLTLISRDAHFAAVDGLQVEVW